MLELAGFSDASLRNLLAAQEYPEGDFATALEQELLFRKAWDDVADARSRRGFE